MSDHNQILFLGSGTSTGVPTLGCSCAVCTSHDPRNKRYRSSLLITTKGNKNIIIDTTPDMRTQLLNHQINQIDAAIITHAHADHIHGIDDLRTFCYFGQKEIPVYTYDDCAKDLCIKFPYIFDQKKYFAGKPILGGGIPNLTLTIVNSQQATQIEDLQFEFSLLPHGYTQTLAIYNKEFAYIIDCNSISDELIIKLKSYSLKYLIIDCVRIKPHQTHLHLAKSLEYIKAINPQMAYLTHLSHDFDHANLTAETKNLAPRVAPAYDGLVLNF